MKKNLIKSLFVLLTSFVIFYGCEDRSDLTAPDLSVDTGDADFTRYVALGNSLTAGVQSGALYQSGQTYGFAALIAKQVNTTFAIPLISDPGLPAGAAGRIEVVSIDPFVTTINTTMGQPINTTYPAPYNNLGVPGAFVYDILNATNANNCYSAVFAGTPNPLFDLILRGLGSEFTQAKLQQPTFLTLWIGNNDVLGFATSGGTIPYTPERNFAGLYSQLIDSIKTLNAKVVVANIPDVSTIPFFTTVGPMIAMNTSIPWGTLPLGFVYQKNSETGMGSGSATQNDLLTGKILVTLAGSEYATLLGLPTGKFYRDNNFPALPSGIDTTQPFGFHPQNPFPNAFVLDVDEISTAKTVVNSYNNTINSLVSNAANFALVDIYSLLNMYRAADLLGGIETDGIRFSTTFVSGGMFSLDGVHLTSQGYALVANEFIKKINEKFNAKIPLINVASIPGSLVLQKVAGIPKFPKNTFKEIMF